jgi:hypothetical protein
MVELVEVFEQSFVGRSREKESCCPRVGALWRELCLPSGQCNPRNDAICFNTIFFCSTRDQPDNVIPILATVRLSLSLLSSSAAYFPYVHSIGRC